MKKLFGIFGWLLFSFLLVSSLIFNKFSPAGESASTTSKLFISWQDHLDVFQGALSCTLLPDDLRERLETLKVEVFANLIAKEELDDGYIFYFEDDKIMLDKVFEFISTEKLCCPFFKFDVSVLPFNKGLALRISGSKEIKSFVANYTDF